MDGLSGIVMQELIAINYAKRAIGLLPDEWYSLDLHITTLKQWSALPSKQQINEAKRILR